MAWLTLVVVLAGAVAAQALTPYEIAKKSLTLDKANTKVTNYKMTVVNKQGKERVYKFTAYDKMYAEGEKKVIRFSEPADQNGVGLLSWERKGADDLQWLYLPSQKKSRQLASADKDDEFMGSDLYMEDMSTQSAEDFDHQVLQQVVFEGKQCYLLESRPKPGVNSAYGVTRSWIDTTTFVAHKMELFNAKGTLIKTILNKRAEQIDGHWTILFVEVRTEGKGKAKTTIEVEKVQYNADVPDRYLKKEFLESF
jgi:outer membrane lipoprotein-sorting protein